MRYALMNGNTVATVTEQEDKPAIPGEWVECENAGPGWVRINGVLQASIPQPSIPPKVTRRQARQALLLAGKLQMVEPAINAIPDATQRAMIMIEWQDSLEFERTRPSLIALAAAIGMTSADLDALFIQAAKL